MKFNEDSGIKIDSQVLGLLESAIKQAGGKSNLCSFVKINYTAMANWLGMYDRQGEYITWEQWKRIKGYLVANGLIDKADPRWMTPSEMRERLMQSTTPEEMRLLEAYRLARPDQRRPFDLLATDILAEKNAQDSKSG